MLKALLKSYNAQRLFGATPAPNGQNSPPSGSLDTGAQSIVCASEADADAHAQALVDDAAVCLVATELRHGGVDTADVLHWVHPVEVHATIETDIFAAPQQTPSAASKALTARTR